MPTTPSRRPHGPAPSSTALVLREARRLHRAAASDSPSVSLPVLRRILAAAAVPAQSLPALFRARDTVQRKHVLRTLAVEAGHPSWEAYSRALPLVDVQHLQQALSAEQGTASLKLWFPSEDQARRHAAEQGGHAVRVGRQGVVLPVPQGGEAP